MGLVFFFQEIDDYIVQAKERGYATILYLARQGLTLADPAVVCAEVKVILFTFFLYTATLTKWIK